MQFYRSKKRAFLFNMHENNQSKFPATVWLHSRNKLIKSSTKFRLLFSFGSSINKKRLYKFAVAYYIFPSLLKRQHTIGRQKSCRRISLRGDKKDTTIKQRGKGKKKKEGKEEKSKWREWRGGLQKETANRGSGIKRWTLLLLRPQLEGSKILTCLRVLFTAGGGGALKAHNQKLLFPLLNIPSSIISLYNAHASAIQSLCIV